MRLRDIGGIIVVDFIDMASEASRNKVIKTMEEQSAPRSHARDDPVVLESRAARVHAQARRQGPRRPTARRVSDVHRHGQRHVRAIGRDRDVSADSRRCEQRRCGRRRRARRADRRGADGVLVRSRSARSLRATIGHPIHVRVDPMIHPEKAASSCERVQRDRSDRHAFASATSTRSSCCPGACRIRPPLPPSSKGDLVEVENAANNAGNFVRIRILDVDDEEDYVLAELVTAGAKPRRKRRGRRARRSPPPSRRGSCASLPKTRRVSRPRGRRSASRRSPKRRRRRTRRCAPNAEARRSPTRSSSRREQCSRRRHDGHRKRRRRRRGRGTRRGRSVRRGDRGGADRAAEVPISGDGAGQHRRRRRRRRGRRGRGGAGAAAMPMPDRHIFEVAADGCGTSDGRNRTAGTFACDCAARGGRASCGRGAAAESLRSREEPKRRNRRAAGARRARRDGELEGTASALALPATQAKPRRTRKTAEKAGARTLLRRSKQNRKRRERKGPPHQRRPHERNLKGFGLDAALGGEGRSLLKFTKVIDGPSRQRDALNRTLYITILRCLRFVPSPSLSSRYSIARVSCSSFDGCPNCGRLFSADDDVGRDAEMVDIAVARRKIARRRYFDRAAVGKRIDRLHDALAEGLRADDRSDAAVLNRARRNLRGRGSVAIHEDREGKRIDRRVIRIERRNVRSPRLDGNDRAARNEFRAYRDCCFEISAAVIAQIEDERARALASASRSSAALSSSPVSRPKTVKAM